MKKKRIITTAKGINSQNYAFFVLLFWIFFVFFSYNDSSFLEVAIRTQFRWVFFSFCFTLFKKINNFFLKGASFFLYFLFMFDSFGLSHKQVYNSTKWWQVSWFNDLLKKGFQIESTNRTHFWICFGFWFFVLGHGPEKTRSRQTIVFVSKKVIWNILDSKKKKKYVIHRSSFETLLLFIVVICCCHWGG